MVETNPVSKMLCFVKEINKIKFVPLHLFQKHAEIVNIIRAPEIQFDLVATYENTFINRLSSTFNANILIHVTGLHYFLCHCKNAP